MPFDIVTKRGDTYNGAVFTIEHTSGYPVDLTGASILMQIKKSASDDEPVLEFTETDGITITDAVNGQFQIDEVIIEILPKIYQYDIQITLSNGKVKTPIDGTFTVSSDVSRPY